MIHLSTAIQRSKKLVRSSRDKHCSKVAAMTPMNSGMDPQAKVSLTTFFIHKDRAQIASYSALPLSTIPLIRAQRHQELMVLSTKQKTTVPIR